MIKIKPLRQFSVLTCKCVLACLFVGLTACRFEAPPLPVACDEVTELFAVADVLADGDHPCIAWVDIVHGRVARSSAASASIYSRNTANGTGVLVSAMHVLGVGWFGAEGEALTAMVHDPAAAMGVPRITLVNPDGGALNNQLTPMFDLYNPDVPAEQHTDFFRDLLPRHDFHFAVVDSQLVSMMPIGAVGPLNDEPPDLYDPAGTTTSSVTFSDAAAGELVIMVGFPSGGGFVGGMAASVGRVLSDEEAEQAVEFLATAGDEEGDIAYDAEVEIMMEGHALPGMSGGGVFDGDGLQVGVIVRASDPIDGLQYVRAVRMNFAVGRLNAALEDLDDAQRQRILPYVETGAPPP